MQIHELTRRRTNEGILDNIKAAGQTIKKGYQQGGVKGAFQAGTSNRAYAQAKQDVAAPEIARQTNALAQQYAKEWQTQSAQLISAEKAAARAAKKTPTPTATAEPITIGGQQLDPKNPKDAELIAKLQSQGTLKEASPSSGYYLKTFRNWADQKLTTAERTTGKSINLEYLYQHIPSSKRTLDQLTNQVYNTRKDPEANTEAVTNYMATAMKFIQQAAAELRKTAPATSQQKTIQSTGDPAKDQLLKKDGWTVTL